MRIGAPSPTRGATHQEGVHVARPSLRALSRPFLSDEQYDAIRQNTYMALQQRRNPRAVAEGTRAGNIFLAAELQWLLQRDAEWLAETAAEYRATPEAWKLLSGYRSASRWSDGFAKSMDVAEGFAAWALVKHQRPRVVVELGTQHGVSSRLWKEALLRYVPDHVLYLCDLEDQRRLIGPGEAVMLLGDGVVSLRQILDKVQVDLLINDAHPYTLIRDSVALGKERGVPCFAFHDVSDNPLRGRPYRVESEALTEEEREAHNTDYAGVGVWERHVMADQFDPAIRYAMAGETDVWRWQIFDSFLGLGVVLQKDGEAA